MHLTSSIKRLREHQSWIKLRLITPKLLLQLYCLTLTPYAFSWQDYQAPRLLQRLLAKKVKMKLAGEAFFAQTSQGGKSFSAGAVIIPISLEQP